MEQAGAVRSGEQEADVEQAHPVAFGLGAGGDDVGQRPSLEPVGDQDVLGAVDEVRNDELGVVGEGEREAVLGVGLHPVVELLDHPVLELVEQRPHVEPGDQHPDHPAQSAHLVEVGSQRVARAGVLDLDGDVAAVAPDRPVHLADRRGRRRDVVELAEPPPPVRPELLPSTPWTTLAGIGGAASWSLVSDARYGPASSSGSAASKIDIAWPNFIAPPLSSPSTLKTCSAVRCWTSAATASAGRPPRRLPSPSVARPAMPSGRVASRAVRVTALRGRSLTDSLSRAEVSPARRIT